MKYILEAPNGDIIKINPDVELEFKICKDDPHTLICTNYDEVYQVTKDKGLFDSLNDEGFIRDFINILDDDFVWCKDIPQDSNMVQHYGTFFNIINTECLKKGKQFKDCCLLVSCDIVPILCFNNFTQEPLTIIDGSYMCGKLENRPVYVCPYVTNKSVYVFEEDSGKIVCKISVITNK